MLASRVYCIGGRKATVSSSVGLGDETEKMLPQSLILISHCAGQVDVLLSFHDRLRRLAARPATPSTLVDNNTTSCAGCLTVGVLPEYQEAEEQEGWWWMLPSSSQSFYS